MSISRRSFIRTGTIAFAGASLLSKKVFAGHSPEKVLGLQLYTVRDDMHKDPLGTLRQLASIGYVNLEHAGYGDRKFYGYPAIEFKNQLDGLGLKMISGHTVMDASHWDEGKNDFTDKWKYTVEDAATVGQKYVISPWLDESLQKDYNALLKWMDVFNKSGELCKKSGMKFGYHNHNFEFSTKINNQRLYDIILTKTDPSLVAQQLDIGNMYGVGGRALELFRQYPGRFELMHVKDEMKTDKPGEMEDGYESTVLGKGVIGVEKIVDTARKKGGTTQFIIEQESYQNMTPIESAKQDFEIMKSWGF